MTDRKPRFTREQHMTLVNAMLTFVGLLRAISGVLMNRSLSSGRKS